MVVIAVVVRAFDVVAVVGCDWVTAAMIAAFCMARKKKRLSPLSSYSLLVSIMSRTRTIFGFLGVTPAAVLQYGVHGKRAHSPAGCAAVVRSSCVVVV